MHLQEQVARRLRRLATRAVHPSLITAAIQPFPPYLAKHE